MVIGSSGLFTAGFDIYKRRNDKPVSLSDCILSHLMQERGITRTPPYAHPFEQAGCERLLRRELRHERELAEHPA